MPKNLSSKEVAWILGQIGITLVRRSKEDVYSGAYQGKNRVVIVARKTMGRICDVLGIQLMQVLRETGDDALQTG